MGLFEQALVAVARVYFRPFESIARGFASKGAIGKFLDLSAPQARDERIAKIDEARTNLQDALSALDDLKLEAEKNKTELEEALKRLEETKAGHAAEARQLKHIRAIAEADITAFRRLAGVPVQGRERLIGFLGGVVASLIAALIWNGVNALF